LTHHQPPWAPDQADIETPSVARIYDYLLGGSHNFPADRAVAERAVAAWPDLPHLARANRAFLHRAVRHLTGAGIDQFLDLGAGIPTVGSVHDIARAAAPGARTVYVDLDPVAVAHGAILLQNEPGARIIQADLREPDTVLRHPALTGHLDLARPLAVLMISVLPWVPDDDDPAAIVARYRDASAAGSYLALSHGTGDFQPETTGRVADVYRQTSTPGTFRSRAQIAALMAGYDPVEPGMVPITRWRPDPDVPDPFHGDEARSSMYAALGKKPPGHRPPG
jgi:S-adenosyl methyltransferase